MAPRSYLVLALLSHGLNTLAQTIQSQFNQVVNLNGDMILNSVQFPDGSKIETFSQTQRQMLVNQNQAPLPGNQVTGSTGNPFMMLSTSSLVIQTNGGTDLVGAQIEIAMNTQMMQQNNINPDNTFVAKLAPDRRSWMIMDGIKSVNTTDNTVRLVKMNQIDGEYAALGRNTRETGLSLTQFGTQQSNSFNVSGSGIQENEFTDGFRMSIRATQPMLINSNVVNGISTTMLSALPPGSQSVNNYRYKVTTNLGGVVSNINRMVAVIQLPINPVRLQTIAQNMGAGPNSNIRLSIAQRGVLINPGGAQASQRTTQKRQDPNAQINTNETLAQDQNSGNTIQAQGQNQPQGQNNGNSNNQPQINGQNNGNSNNQPQNDGQNNGNSNSQPQNNGQNNGNSNTQPQNNGQNNGNSNNQPQNNGQNNNNNNNNNGQINNGGTQTNNPAATALLLSPTFTPIAANAVLDQMNGRLAIPVSQLDGEYIITIAMVNGAQSPPQPQPAGIQGQGQQQPQGQGIQSQSPQGQSPPAPAAPLNEPQGAAPPAAGAPTPANQPGGTIPAPQVAGTGGAPASVPNATAAFPPPPPVKRQLGPGGQPATGGYVEVSMAWISMMANNQMNGLPINVAAMMDGMLAPGQAPLGAPTQAASIGSPAQGSSVSGLISGLKARRFQA
ncbi:hypothetical protein FKW77_000897 [Venturia effusa]|uniref:Uncharacterized protein n=1 Tax=Venturia effusa TaxID=50376 RepID=A0A517LBU5_9PEZI|nr:hypothetical protein FKW77_000897 [Venturia effusa]